MIIPATNNALEGKDAVGRSTPSGNSSFSKNGIVKLWLKTANAASGSTVQIYIDDSDGTEGSATLNVINDGAWHGYIFDLTTWSGVKCKW